LSRSAIFKSKQVSSAPYPAINPEHFESGQRFATDDEFISAGIALAQHQVDIGYDTRNASQAVTGKTRQSNSFLGKFKSHGRSHTFCDNSLEAGADLAVDL